MKKQVIEYRYQGESGYWDDWKALTERERGVFGRNTGNPIRQYQFRIAEVNVEPKYQVGLEFTFKHDYAKSRKIVSVMIQRLSDGTEYYAYLVLISQKDGGYGHGVISEDFLDREMGKSN